MITFYVSNPGGPQSEQVTYSISPTKLHTGKNYSRFQTIGSLGFKILQGIAIGPIHNILKVFQDTRHPLEVIQVAPEPLLDQLSMFV